VTKPLRILNACESSGIMRDAFIRAGHWAMSCDLLDTERPGPHYKGDVRDVLDGDWDIIIAHPTCTRLTNAGARWLIEPPTKLAPWQYPADVVAAYAAMTRDQRLAFMWDELHKGAEFYRLFKKAKAKIGKAIENPIMHCHARALIQPGPRQVVQPWWFGDPFFKATGWELEGLPKLVETNRLVPPKKGTQEHKEWSAVHLASPGPDRWRERSRSFPGMCEAAAKQWGRIGQMQSGELIQVATPTQQQLILEQAA
jgi:hypothetical protein